jgi:hypothetical protein
MSSFREVQVDWDFVAVDIPRPCPQSGAIAVRKGTPFERFPISRQQAKAGRRP